MLYFVKPQLIYFYNCTNQPPAYYDYLLLILPYQVSNCLPDKGVLKVDNHNMREVDLYNYRNKLAVVSQNTTLISGSIRKNITYGSGQIDNNTLQNVIKKVALDNFINDLPKGLDTIINENDLY